MPDPVHPDTRHPKRPAAQRPASERPAAERAADHAAIDRLGSELLPALIAKLGATGLGELEVREGPWRVRLRRPADGAAPGGAGSSGTSGSGRDRRPAERHATDRLQERPVHLAHHADPAPARGEARRVATSPAVGIYRPRTDLSVGDRVRAGDRVGAVDMLGVAQEVLSPVDGVVGASLAESGDAVEYGQELLVVETVPVVTAATGGAGAA